MVSSHMEASNILPPTDFYSTPSKATLILK